MQANVHLVKSFTQNPEQGSPTGVVLDADNLSDAQMQHIATELNFAESVFVQSPTVEGADYRLRFFAPNHEVDLCGHGTIGGFRTLIEQGKVTIEKELGKVVLVQETRAGTLEVTCYADGRIVMKQKDPEFGTVEENKERVAQMLGIPVTDFIDDLPLQVVSTGTPKLFVPLKSLEALRAIRYDRSGIEAIKDYCRNTTARGIYPFTMESPIPETDFYARQFNPLADENEDAITGVAAGALGCYADKYKLLGKQQFTVAQGYDLGMGGNMVVDVSDGVRVGGYAVSYGERIIDLT
jgi:trans-2,3-dihydro-3-hydroxyanthranilate isomerase